MRQGDHEVQRSIESCLSLVNRKNNRMMGSRRTVASTIGAAVVDWCYMRATVGEGGGGVPANNITI